MKKIIAILLTLVMCLSICACGKKVPQEVIDAYNNANASFSQGRYEEAAKFYVEAGDYEDSQQKLLEIYYYAVTCFEHERYDEAFSLFDLLSGSVEFTSSSVYDKAIANARTIIDSKNYSKDRTNPSIVYKFLDVAMAHANEQQKWEVNEYKTQLSNQLYEGTLFWEPTAYVNSVPVEEVEGQYVHYHYNFSTGSDAGDFLDAHSLWYNLYERKEFSPVPKWLNDITGFDYEWEQVYCDAYGNMIVCTWDGIIKDNFGYKAGGMGDVYIIYAEYIESMNN